MSVREAFDEHRDVALASLSLVPQVEAMSQMAVLCLKNGGKILVCGNGGSAADAQHFAAELLGRFELERDALPAVALTTDTSALTALGNDYGFELVFERQVLALARPGDLLVALTTSGNSANVVAAARRAREIGCQVVALTGAGPGLIPPLAHLHIAVPSLRVSRIQEIHCLCLHAVAQEVEARLFGAERRMA